MITSLAQSVLFRDLSEEEITTLLDRFPHRIKSFEKKETIFHQEDVCDKLMLLLEGMVESHMVDSSGKLIVVSEFKAGSLLAPGFLFSDINRYPVTAVVVEKSTVLFFRQTVVLEMLQENIKLLHNFLRVISNRSQFLSKKVKLHALMPLKNKISNYLVSEFKNQENVEITIPHTQQELADRFGVARPSLARAFAELEKAGIIEISNRKLIIKNLVALKQLAE